jgi:hypothetical protein
MGAVLSIEHSVLDFYYRTSKGMRLDLAQNTPFALCGCPGSNPIITWSNSLLYTHLESRAADQIGAALHHSGSYQDHQLAGIFLSSAGFGQLEAR